MDWLAILNEYGFPGAAILALCWVIWWLIKWLRELIEARQKDAERFAERSLEREKETISAINDLTNAVREWGRNGTLR